MKSFFIILIASLSLLRIGSAQDYQQWVQTYNGSYNGSDRGVDIAANKFGNVYTTGYTMISSSESKIVTIKYNSEGQLIWTRIYVGPANYSTQPTAIALDDSGNVYICGFTVGINTLSDYDYVTIKYNTNGDEQWANRYDGPGSQVDIPWAIAVDDSGNVVVTGASYGVGTASDYATIKYSSEGIEQWVVRYGEPLLNQGDVAQSVVVDHIGNIYVSGGTTVNSPGTNQDYCTIKYNSEGIEQWVRKYNGLNIGSNDEVTAMKLDHNGNVYVTGYTTYGQSKNIATIKYNPSGDLIWVKLHFGTADNAGVKAITIDKDNNIILTGNDYNWQTGNSDCIVIKYDSDGNKLWYQQYNSGGNNLDLGWDVITDSTGNIFMTGVGKLNGNEDALTIKYNSFGTLEWVQNYNGSANEDDVTRYIAIDTAGNIYVAGTSTEIGTSTDILTIKYINEIAVLKPKLADKWIAGNKYLIKWIKPGWSSINVKCILNYQTSIQKEYSILSNISSSITEYEWDVPDTMLSFRTKIIISNASDTSQKVESKFFRIKPYLLTKLNSDLTYYAFDKTRDQWGFSNIAADMWPATWTNQFNYQGIDPFTGSQYSQIQGNGVFAAANSTRHPDWISWVNTFSINNCYLNIGQRIYSAAAITRWAARNSNWNGSCFGIAAANALAFSKRVEFQNKYINFPAFSNPITVVSDTAVKRTVNELFTHQYGKPSTVNDISGNAKTPSQTLNDIKQMLTDDNSPVKTFTIFNNGGSGGHTILAYGLKQDPVQKNLYYIKVYDNSNPNSNNPITIDTAANAGNGTWSTPDWAGWGGNRGIYLEVNSDNYFNKANFKNIQNQQSPFVLSESELEISNPIRSSIRITDLQGNSTGYSNNILLSEIPNSIPLMIKNGSETPPYGYSLPADNYSVVLNEFIEDTVATFFFAGNKSFVYERSGATQTQMDRLFFDGGVSAANPDAQTKTIKFLNLINETTQEKLAVVRSIELAQNDSVKIENPDSNKVKLISYGTAKDYDIELNYVTENGIRRFGDFDVQLAANTSHTFVPIWTDLTNSELQVLVDIGNDGTIDDTLKLVNQVTGIGEDQGSLLTPNSYNLAQNYPNPFNPSTIISWQSPIGSHQTLKVYDVLGNEVATLVDEFREAGRYEITFDASQLASGIYLYKLQAGSFVETKKMILIR